MASLVEGYAYDIFISYRQNDNRSGWVRQFVEDLREELGATLKDPVNIYFDENPHDGLQETHDVDKSLEGKLKCILFIPILSRTYCDVKSFAWNREFLPFCSNSQDDSLGADVRLQNGNVASRVLPVQIHDLNDEDKKLFEKATGRPIRAVEFIFRANGVNRPLTPSDTRSENVSRTIYKDQVNKLAIAINERLTALVHAPLSVEPESGLTADLKRRTFWSEVRRRNVLRAGFVYLILAIIALQLLGILTPLIRIEERLSTLITKVLVAGIPISLVLAWLFEWGPGGMIKTSSAASLANPLKDHQKKPLTSPLTIFVMLLSTGLMAVYAIIIIEPAQGPPQSQKPLSIAILPIESNEKDAQSKFVAEAITDDIISKLTTLPQLRVTNRRSTQHVKSDFLGAYETIAGNLNVSTLLIGSLNRNGNTLEIKVRLIDGSDDSFLWGNTYDRTVNNFKDVHTKIALAIAKRLIVDLSEEEIRNLTQQPSNNDSAIYRYQLGRSCYYKYRKSANDSAIAYFKSAIEADNGCALAWSGLADAYNQEYLFGGGVSWADSAIRIGTHAIKLDSSLSEGHKAVGSGYMYKKLYDKAFPYLKRAVDLAPSNPQAVGNLGTAYLLRSELKEAIELHVRSAGLSPDNWIPFQLLGLDYTWLEDRERALEALKKSLSINPYWQTYEYLAYNYIFMNEPKNALALIPELLKLGPENYKILEKAGIIALYGGDWQRAETFFRRSIENHTNYRTDPNTMASIGLGQILLTQGKKVEANVLLEHALEVNLNEIERGSQDDDPPFRISALYALRGDKEKMLEWLNKAIEANWIDYRHVTDGPWFVRYKSDPDLNTMVDHVRDRIRTIRAGID